MATSPLPPEVIQPTERPIAPWWHTAILVVFLLVFSAMESGGHKNLDHLQRMKLYSITVMMEWGMLLFLVWGVRRNRQTSVRELIGGRWNKPEDFLMDVVIAFGFWVGAAMILAGVGYALGMANIAHAKEMQERIGSMLPQGGTEIALWLAVSATAGICEEIIFRGYFQRQFGVWMKSAWAGVVVQALIFGGSHAYEGWKKMIQIAVFGFLFGVLAYYRKSLRPGMMAHFGQDAVAGVLGRFALKNLDKTLPR